MSVKVLRDALVASSAVTALVPASRITPLVRPQTSAVPAILLQRVSTTPQNNLVDDGALDGNAVQLDIYAETYAKALAIAAAIRTALRLTFQCDSEIDAFEFETDSETDPELFRITQQWSVWV